MIRALVGLTLVAAFLGACATADRTDVSGQAFATDTRAADCDRLAQMATPPESPVSSSSSGASIDRDMRRRAYRECMGVR